MISKCIKWFLSFVRLAWLKIKYGKRLIFDYSENKKPVYIGKGTQIKIDKKSRIVVGGGSYISQDCQLAALDESNITIKTSVYIGKGSRMFARDGMLIEKHVLIADNVSIYDHNHDIYGVGKTGHDFTAKAIVIGEHSWLATNVVVTKGTSIGKYVTVGANSVAKGNLEDNSIYASSKAVLVKKIKVE